MSFERAKYLLSTFSALEEEIDVQTFVSRFFIQKYGYFLQEFGADLGYAFGMYIHGPYSPDLTRDAYALQQIEYTDEEIESVSVNTDAIEELQTLIEEVDDLVSVNKSKQYWFELFASLHFLCKHGYPKIEGLEDAKSNRKLARYGDDLVKGFEILEEHNLV